MGKESLNPRAAAAAKSLQLCPTLCDPIDGGPPGSPVPGILQARTLEWVAISYSNAWKWKVKVKSLSRVRLVATPWTAAHQAPPSMGFSRQEYWSGVPLPLHKLKWKKQIDNIKLQKGCRSNWNWYFCLYSKVIQLLWKRVSNFLKEIKQFRNSCSTFVFVQSLSCVWLFVTPWTSACQIFPSFSISQGLIKLRSIESVIPSIYLVFCRPLLLLLWIFLSIRVFSNESALHIRWPKYWSFSFSISPSGLISFRTDWLDLLAVQGTLKSLLQHHSSKASILQHSAFFTV